MRLLSLNCSNSVNSTNLPDEEELYELIDELYEDTDLFDAEDFKEMLSESYEDLDDPAIEFVKKFL